MLPAQLASTEEYIEGQFTGNLGEVLIRCALRPPAPGAIALLQTFHSLGALRHSCNNVLYLRAAPQEEEEGDAAMPEA